MALPMRLAVSLVLMLLLAPILSGTSAGLTRSTTVWSGTISLPDGYLVQSNQVLVIQAGTSILLGDGERLGVDGRISIEGTESSPVTIESISGDHRGVIFNSSSNNLGSTIDNLTITGGEYGITVYGSNPLISNLHGQSSNRSFRRSISYHQGRRDRWRGAGYSRGLNHVEVRDRDLIRSILSSHSSGSKHRESGYQRSQSLVQLRRSLEWSLCVQRLRGYNGCCSRYLD